MLIDKKRYIVVKKLTTKFVKKKATVTFNNVPLPSEEKLIKYKEASNDTLKKAFLKFKNDEFWNALATLKFNEKNKFVNIVITNKKNESVKSGTISSVVLNKKYTSKKTLKNNNTIKHKRNKNKKKKKYVELI